LPNFRRARLSLAQRVREKQLIRVSDFVAVERDALELRYAGLVGERAVPEFGVQTPPDLLHAWLALYGSDVPVYYTGLQPSAAKCSPGCALFCAFARPMLILSNSIGTTLNMWDMQIPDLSKHFRVLRYDARGHGASDVPAGGYSVDRLGRDVIELLDALNIGRALFCGLSLGGVVGQWLGIHAPERIDRLILCNTASFLGPAEQWDNRIASVLHAENLSETAEMFLTNWFPARMLKSESSIIRTVRAMLLATHPQGYAGCYAAVRDMDMRRTIALIRCPTLVIAGQYDTVTLPSHSELIAATIPGSKLIILPSWRVKA
jgi:Predicted hydrolases or acyltransferases (alpha/beta hydrolase superfamily)